jgi:hypothetical protein
MYFDLSTVASTTVYCGLSSIINFSSSICMYRYCTMHMPYLSRRSLIGLLKGQSYNNVGESHYWFF